MLDDGDQERAGESAQQQEPLQQGRQQGWQHTDWQQGLQHLDTQQLWWQQVVLQWVVWQQLGWQQPWPQPCSELITVSEDGGSGWVSKKVD
jgi:hypothetical protein